MCTTAWQVRSPEAAPRTSSPSSGPAGARHPTTLARLPLPSPAPHCSPLSCTRTIRLLAFSPQPTRPQAPFPCSSSSPGPPSAYLRHTPPVRLRATVASGQLQLPGARCCWLRRRPSKSWTGLGCCRGRATAARGRCGCRRRGLVGCRAARRWSCCW
jgi:hypothetical protein